MKKTVSAVLAAAMMMVGAQGIVSAAPTLNGAEMTPLYEEWPTGEYAVVGDEDMAAIVADDGSYAVIDADGNILDSGWVDE